MAKARPTKVIEWMIAYLEGMIIDDWVLRGIMVGHKECWAADALGLVRQQVAALPVRIIGHHDACSQVCQSGASCLAAMRALQQPGAGAWVLKKSACCVLQLCSDVNPAPGSSNRHQQLKGEASTQLSCIRQLALWVHRKPRVNVQQGAHRAAHCCAAVLALLCPLLSALHLQCLSAPVISFLE